MLQKAYVEEVIYKYSYRIRVPVLHKIKNAPGCTPTEELPIATLAVTPGNIPHILKDSVVYVDFESDDDSLPVILGVLLSSFEESSKDSKSSSNIVNLEVSNVCSLPKETNIGDVTSYQIGCLTKLDRPVDDYVAYTLFYTHVKQELIDTIFPVGSIIYRSDDQDPSELFGGQWERLTDRFLWDKSSEAVGIIGGQETVKLEADNLPEHYHDYYQFKNEKSSTGWDLGGSATPFVSTIEKTSETYKFNNSTYSEVTNSPFSIIPPYEVVRVYKRIA